MARLSLALLLAVCLAGLASANYIGYTDLCLTTANKFVCTGNSAAKPLTLTGQTTCKYISVGCYVDGIGSPITYSSARCTKLDTGFVYNGVDYTSCGSCTVNTGGTSVTLRCTDKSDLPANSACPNPTQTGAKMCGDPHFSAPGGIMFDWSGIREQTFSIISDSELQVNAHFIGERPNSGSVEPGSWIQEISMGYMDGDEVHFLSVGLAEEKDFETKDVFYFTFDGEDIPVGSGTAEYKWTSPDGKATVVRPAHQRAQAHVKIEGLFEATFYPRVESRIQLDPLGKYLDMDMDDLRLSRHSHGVLGQMFRPDAVERKNAVTTNMTGHEFMVEGKTEDYKVSSLQSYDSVFNQFNLVAGMKVKSFSFVDTARKLLGRSSEKPPKEPLSKFSAECAQEGGSQVCI